MTSPDWNRNSCEFVPLRCEDLLVYGDLNRMVVLTVGGNEDRVRVARLVIEGLDVDL